MQTLRLYAIFALFAIIINLSAQALVYFLLGNEFPFVLFLALTVGTGSAVIVKYFLDQKWVFSHSAQGLSKHAKQFGAYSLTGVITTALFWGVEITFDLLTQSAIYRYLGGALGISLSYVLKYCLDKRYVFTDSAPK